ncbi:MAG: cytochrome-c peroxidase [Pseudomarimonas sp.]
MRQIAALPSALILLLVLVPPVFAQVPPPPPLAALGAPPVPPENPQTPAKIALGQTLFWDEQLSVTGTIACGTCHAPAAGGSDPRVSENMIESTHPGPDGVFATNDDVIGAAGVPLHAADGSYQTSTSFGMRPQVGNRQSISAINAAYPPTLFWDGRARSDFIDPDTQATLIAVGGALENQALGPLVNTAEMAHAGGSLADMRTRIAGIEPLALAAAVPTALSSWINGRRYPALFAEVFGSETITSARIAMAIASYERSLVSNQTPHDAEQSGTPSLTPLERQGRNAYNQAGCQRCHGGALLSDNNFHYTGVRPQAADPGRFAVTGLNPDRGRMRTPGLRNIELTAPYMADGSIATLEEVVAFYERGGDFTAPNLAPQMTPFVLTPAQRTALVAFLRRPLTDPRVLTQSGPFARPTLYSESSAVPQLVGEGVAGQAGIVPRLIAIEPPLVGATNFTIAIEGAAAGASARAILDLVEPANANSAGVSVQTFTVSGQGNASLHMQLPSAPLASNVDLYLRVFVADAAAVGGFSATASARFRILGGASDVFVNGFEP